MKTTTTPPLFFLLAVTWFAPPVAAETAYPVEWIRQIGTSSIDISESVAVDSSGNVYISGYTLGDLEGANAGSTDAFLAKFDSNGTELWTQQIGATHSDRSFSVAVDGSGNAFISGATFGFLEGTNAATLNAFLTKFDTTGNVLWTESIGTNGFDLLSGFDSSKSVAVDRLGNAYISGVTWGNLEGINAGKSDSFLTKFDPNGTELWTQQIGTIRSDESNAVAVDDSGNIYISGYTEVTNTGSIDAFLTKFDSNGAELWTKLKGADSSDASHSVAVDGAGNVYISGGTGSSLEGTNAGNWDAFLTKFDPTGSEIWTQQIGTSVRDISWSVVVDRKGNAFISGETRGSLDGTRNFNIDAFLSKFDSNGNELWTQQIGTNPDDGSRAVTVDGWGNVYISGYTKGHLEGTNAGDEDAFLIKFTNPVPEPTTGLLLRQRQQEVAITLGGEPSALAAGV